LNEIAERNRPNQPRATMRTKTVLRLRSQFVFPVDLERAMRPK
jgi:hypothetical protein